MSLQVVIFDWTYCKFSKFGRHLMQFASTDHDDSVHMLCISHFGAQT